MATEVGTLEVEALRRKERLKALKRKRDDPEARTDSEAAGEEQQVALPKPVFRSYKPLDESLQNGMLPRGEPGDVETKVKDQLEQGKSKIVVDEVDLLNLAPRKPDWDLKRDVSKKLEKLERRTQRAIAELIRERLKKGQENFLAAVNVGAAANAKDTDED